VCLVFKKLYFIRTQLETLKNSPPIAEFVLRFIVAFEFIRRDEFLSKEWTFNHILSLFLDLFIFLSAAILLAAFIFFLVIICPAWKFLWCYCCYCCLFFCLDLVSLFYLRRSFFFNSFHNKLVWYARFFWSLNLFRYYCSSLDLSLILGKDRHNPSKDYFKSLNDKKIIT